MTGLLAFDDIPAPLLIKSAVGVALILLLAAGAIALIRRVRIDPEDQIVTSSEALTQFRELHDRGELSDEEYLLIKGRLVEKLHVEISEDKQSG